MPIYNVAIDVKTIYSVEAPDEDSACDTALARFLEAIDEYAQECVTLDKVERFEDIADRYVFPSEGQTLFVDTDADKIKSLL